MSSDQSPFERVTAEAVAAEKPTSNVVLKLFLGLLALLAGSFVILALLIPAGRRGRPAAYRTQCKNNLKQIGLALHNYHDVYGGFPPAVLSDANGQPLHSWRTLILPFMEQQELYEKIDLSKPWDHPVNAEAFQECPYIYQCPSADLPGHHTSYVAIVGEDCFLHPSESRVIRQIEDGTSNTVAVVEVSKGQSVHWMSPSDSVVDVFLHTVPEVATTHEGGFQGMIADGSVRFFSSHLELETRQALTTIAGGEVVGEF